MSNFILTEAWRTALPPIPKLLLISLSDQANDDGICWPSTESLMQRTGLARATVFRHLGDLEEAGHISRESRSGRSTVFRIHPSQAETRLTERPHPSQAETPPVSPVRPTRLSCETQNHKEPSIEPSIEPSNKPAKFCPSAFLALQGVSLQVVEDWLKLRKVKKAAVTQTAIEGVQREAMKADLDLEAALRVCCERGWAGFKAEWFLSKPNPARQQFLTPHQQREENNRRSTQEWLEEMGVNPGAKPNDIEGSFTHD